jgi:hypothetical protein
MARPQQNLYADAVMPEQHHKQDHEHDQPNQTMPAAAIIAAAISIVAATSAEQQNEDEKQDEQAHEAVLNCSMGAVPTAGAGDNSFVEKKVPAACRDPSSIKNSSLAQAGHAPRAALSDAIETHGGECFTCPSLEPGAFQTPASGTARRHNGAKAMLRPPGGRRVTLPSAGAAGREFVAKLQITTEKQLADCCGGKARLFPTPCSDHGAAPCAEPGKIVAQGRRKSEAK